MNTLLKVLFAGACALSIMAVSSITFAQSDSLQRSTAGGSLDTIVVTARKREESLQNVPISITAIDADELREANIFSLENIAQSTPGFTFEDAGGVSAPTIRGLSQTDLRAFTSNVGVFLDGVFLNSRSSVEFANLDLQRVEVL
ncbi:MAG: TonB-dependent receptor plug domain-containing protein, partial [Gammaproteobacteria bacterium]|nr:TonB-dependent receptor plug domain-containing protein [Gammaproteobacteria bacterium]